jgi:hypothetical protein
MDTPENGWTAETCTADPIICEYWLNSHIVSDGLLNLILVHERAFPCGGGLEYPHRSPASRRRRRKENPVPGGITGPPCHWGTWIQRPGPPSWRLDARLMTLLCKKIIVTKSKEAKSRWSNSRQIWQNLLRKAMAQRGLFCQWWWYERAGIAQLV